MILTRTPQIQHAWLEHSEIDSIVGLFSVMYDQGGLGFAIQPEWRTIAALQLYSCLYMDSCCCTGRALSHEYSCNARGLHNSGVVFGRMMGHELEG